MRDVLGVYASRENGIGLQLAGGPHAPHVLVEALAAFDRAFSRCNAERMRAEREKARREAERKRNKNSRPL